MCFHASDIPLLNGVHFDDGVGRTTKQTLVALPLLLFCFFKILWVTRSPSPRSVEGGGGTIAHAPYPIEDSPDAKETICVSFHV